MQDTAHYLKSNVFCRCLPVVRFAELHLWGRSTAAVPLEDDLELIAAITAGAGGRSGATPAAGGHP